MPVPPNPLLDLAPGVGQVASSVRFEVVDRDLKVVGDLRVLAADSISAKAAGNIKRTMSGFKLDEYGLREVDPFRHRVKPYWRLEDGTEWPLGVFCFTDSAAHLASYVDVLETTMVDQGFDLDQGTRATFGIGPSGSILPAILEVLAQVKITSLVIPEGSSARVMDPVIWPAGTSRLQIVNELCALAGWLPPYFDNNGILNIRTPPDIDRVRPDHNYPLDSERSRVLAGSIVENDNLLDAPNVYLVICSGPADGEIAASAQVAADLPFSVENRRFEVTETVRVQGITSTEQAQRMAETLAAAAGLGFKNVSFDAFADPRHDLFQTVSWEGKTYRELGWNLKLKPGGPHSHEITRGGFPLAG